MTEPQLLNGKDFIISIDPGKTTGIVLYAPETGETYSYELPALDQPSAVTVGKEIRDYLILYHDRILTVVCEDWEFRHTGHSVDARHACGPIGVIQYLCWSFDVHFVLRKPMLRSRITDERLKSAGLWWPHGAGHARQAMKHVLAYLMHVGDRQVLEKVYPRDDVTQTTDSEDD